MCATVGAQAGVLRAEATRQESLVGAQSPARARVLERPQRVEDHGDVDDLLQRRAPCRRQVAEGGGDHRDERHADAGQHAFDRDAAGAPGDHDGLAEAVEPVDREHDVGGLRRRGRAAGPDRDTDVGKGERRCIVDAVAHHDRRTPRVLGPDRVDLFRRSALGEYLVDADHRTDRLRRLFAVAGDHDDATDAVSAQPADRAGRVGADRVVEQHRATRARRRLGRRP